MCVAFLPSQVLSLISLDSTLSQSETTAFDLSLPGSLASPHSKRSSLKAIHYTGSFRTWFDLSSAILRILQNSPITLNLVERSLLFLLRYH